jgi:hypothetical protein
MALIAPSCQGSGSEPCPDESGDHMALGARNRVAGTLKSIAERPAVANIELDVNVEHLVASITVEAAPGPIRASMARPTAAHLRSPAVTRMRKLGARTACTLIASEPGARARNASERLVRKGSTVRVRPRALENAPLRRVFFARSCWRSVNKCS